MNERLAFFCERDHAPGHLDTWTGTDGIGQTLWQVWCRAPLRDPGPDPVAGDPAQVQAQVQARIAAAGGGLIARTRQRGDTTQLTITMVPAADFDPATRMLLLPPGQPPAWHTLDGGALDLSPGAFVLLPATGADQANLRAFLDHLGRLPEDYRGLLLNVLRRPGIEGALWRLERRLERLPDRPAAGAGPAAPGPRDRPWPWVLTGLLLLNLLASLGGAWWVKGSSGGPEPQGVVCIDWPAAAPVPDWSACGPPWFCEAPLAPGPRETARGSALAAPDPGQPR